MDHFYGHNYKIKPTTPRRNIFAPTYIRPESPARATHDISPGPYVDRFLDSPIPTTTNDNKKTDAIHETLTTRHPFHSVRLVAPLVRSRT